MSAYLTVEEIWTEAWGMSHPLSLREVAYESSEAKALADQIAENERRLENIGRNDAVVLASGERYVVKTAGNGYVSFYDPTDFTWRPDDVPLPILRAAIASGKAQIIQPTPPETLPEGE